MNIHADKTLENKRHSAANAISQKKSDAESTFQFIDNRPEAIAQMKLQGMANNSPQVSQQKVIQEIANNSLQARRQPTGGVLQMVAGLVKIAARKLTFDDLVWGTHADHYATEAKYVNKGRKIVEGGKRIHTTFAADKAGIRQDLINQNIKKTRGWMDSKPAADQNFLVSPKMGYVTHEQTANGIVSTYGHGYPVVRVRPDLEDLEEATGDSNGASVGFYSPYHLQDVEEA